MDQVIVLEVAHKGAHLNQRIVPPIANKDRLKADVMRTGNGFSILTFDIFIKNRPVVSAVALWQDLGFSNLNMEPEKDNTYLWQNGRRVSNIEGKPP